MILLSLRIEQSVEMRIKHNLIKLKSYNKDKHY
jgi:hypothetical protein